MKVLIRNAGFTNKGAEAMLLTTINELWRRRPDLEFLVCLPSWQQQRAFDEGIIAVPAIPGVIKKLSLIAKHFVLSRHVRRAARINLLSTVEIITASNVDAVIDIGGFTYGDYWGVDASMRAMAWVDYCSSHAKPYIFMPQAWGAFEQSIIRNATKAICEQASLIYARDETSLGHLNTLELTDTSKIIYSPDIVFSFNGDRRDVGKFILNSYGIASDNIDCVGMAPNLRVYEKAGGHGIKNSYVHLMCHIAKWVLENTGATIFLFANEVALGGKPRVDDLFICSLIKTSLSEYKDRVIIADFEPARRAQALLGEMSLVIGSRFHALLLAISRGVPSVSLGWSHKYKEMMKLVGLEDFSIEQETSEADMCVELVKRAWIEKESIRRNLLPRVTEIRSIIDRTFDHVSQTLS